MTMNSDFTAVVQKVAGGYIAFVEECPGTGIYGETFEEALYELESTLAPLLPHEDESFSIMPDLHLPCRSKSRPHSAQLHLVRRGRASRQGLHS
jgi:predicted RNase H-like HicB family nuclease